MGCVCVGGEAFGLCQVACMTVRRNNANNNAPGAPHLAPAADVRDGKDDAPLQQRQAVRVEGRVDAGAVGPMNRWTVRCVCFQGWFQGTGIFVFVKPYGHTGHAPVAVEEAGEGLPVGQGALAAVGQRRLAVDDGDGHLAAVVGGGLQPLTGQRGGVVVRDLHLVLFRFVGVMGGRWWYIAGMMITDTQIHNRPTCLRIVWAPVLRSKSIVCRGVTSEVYP